VQFWQRKTQRQCVALKVVAGSVVITGPA
jgi:hypothetical protein